MIFCTATLGCKVNQSETRAVEALLISRGHAKANMGEGCDVCFINTCAVTAESVRKSRQAIRRLKRLEPGALIAAFGCLSQLEPDGTAEIGADFIGGSGGRREFALEIEKFLIERKDPGEQGAECGEQTCLFPIYRVDDPGKRRVFEEIFPLGEINADRDAEAGFKTMTDDGTGFKTMAGAKAGIKTITDDGAGSKTMAGAEPGAAFASGVACESGDAVHLGGHRTRALLKIQDGCNNFCTFCVVPYVRGRVRSLSVERAADLARELDGQGYKEIVVTGIEISSYGRDLDGKPPLQEVLRTISDAAPRARLRLGSLDPGALSEDFCDSLSAVKNLCGHFHLSLQSGCDETLRRMGRLYDTEVAGRAINLLRDRFAGCGITADLIAGFPGETESEFEQTLAFIKDMAFSGMHIFPFSPRPGTPAAHMPGQVAKGVRRERARIASAAARELAHDFELSQVGKIVEVLFERRRGDFWTGHSGNYIEITAMSGGARNSVSNVRIISAEDGFVWGEIAG